MEGGDIWNIRGTLPTGNSYEDGETGPQAKERGWPQEAEDGPQLKVLQWKETKYCQPNKQGNECFLGPIRKGHSSSNTLTLAQWTRVGFLALKKLRVIDLCCMSCLLLFVMEAVENKYIDHWKSFSLCLGVTPKKEQTFVSGFLLGCKMNYTWPNLWFNFCSSEKEGKNQSAWSETGGFVLTVASIWTPEHIAHSPSYLIFHFC